MKRATLLTIGLVLSGCASSSGGEHGRVASGPSPAATARTPAPLAAPAVTTLPFIDDDYAGALAQAKARHKPLFVDTWAIWCHTCMSMRAYVFTDPKILARRDDFVWLAIDSEKAQNEDFLRRFPAPSLPTLWVIDPSTEIPAMKWPGSLTAPELLGLLEGSLPDDVHGGASSGEAAAALLRGNQAYAAGANGEAIKAYRQALAAAKPAWKERATAVDMLVSRLSEAKDEAECAKVAAAEGSRLPAGTSRVNVAVAGTACALELPKNARPQLPSLVAELTKLASDPQLPVLADDRSGAYEELVYALSAQGEAAEARKMARAWAEFLESAAKSAPNAASRAVFDPHRLNAYLQLGEPERALPMLTESERDFPDDYNPAARLARAYFEMKRYDDALAAAERARRKAYGPRKLKIYLLSADVNQAKGDRAAERVTLEEALAYAKTIPLGVGYEKLRLDMEKRLKRLGNR